MDNPWLYFLAGMILVPAAVGLLLIHLAFSEEGLDTPEDLAARERMLGDVEKRFWDRGLRNIFRSGE